MASGLVICSTAGADPDGDGWGWENNASCRVGSTTSSNQATPANTQPTISSQNNAPATCSSADVDPDGDGWGWENNASCRVIANSDSSGSSISAPQDRPQQSSPACSIPALDENNDGFGRENNQICIVDTPVSIRIMALGDSITHGHSFGNAASYRQPLNTIMTSADCQFDMVGSQRGNFLHNTYVAPHEGYSGHTADQILNGFVNAAGNNEGISVTINRYQPHVVLLHIGTNDMRLGQNIDQTVAEMDQIISVILAADSAPVVFLANVVPWYANARVGADVVILGDRIEAYAAQLNNPRVRLVNVRAGFNRSMMRADNAHPNPAGEQHIAERFFAAYDDAGYCRQ